MSILIKGMEMPVIEMEWTLRYGADGKWYAIDTNAETTDGEWHEIIPVPPHGDLIDRDALTISTAVPLNGKPYRYVHIDNIENAPTIIPTDPSEEQRKYEAQVEAVQYCEMYEPTYDPETGAL